MPKYNSKVSTIFATFPIQSAQRNMSVMVSPVKDLLEKTLHGK